MLLWKIIQKYRNRENAASGGMQKIKKSKKFFARRGTRQIELK